MGLIPLDNPTCSELVTKPSRQKEGMNFSQRPSAFGENPGLQMAQTCCELDELTYPEIHCLPVNRNPPVDKRNAFGLVDKLARVIVFPDVATKTERALPELPALLAEADQFTLGNVVPGESGLVAVLAGQALQVGRNPARRDVLAGIDQAISTELRKARHAGGSVVEVESRRVVALVGEVVRRRRGRLELGGFGHVVVGESHSRSRIGCVEERDFGAGRAEVAGQKRGRHTLGVEVLESRVRIESRRKWDFFA